MEIDWDKTLKDWQPSPGAEKVTEGSRIDALWKFCEFVANNMWDKIFLFEHDSNSSPLATKQQLTKDNLSKASVFEIAAQQIKQHREVWRVKQARFPNRLTYEFPIAVQIDNEVRYMKFQIEEGLNGLASPRTVKRVCLRYHVSNRQIEVMYVEK